MKGSSPQTVTTSPDAATQGYVTGQGGGGNSQAETTLRNLGFGDLANRLASQGGSGIPGFGGLRNWAVNAAQQPVNPSPVLNQAVSGLQGYAQAGQQGLNAQTDPNAAAQFMNPYTAAMDPVFAKLRAQAVNSANGNATAQGAFGGSRAAVTGGVALGNIANQQAGFNYQGFTDAMQRALQSANLGLGANSLLSGAGQYLTNLPMNTRLQQLQLLLGGIGPYGQTQSVQTQSDPLSGILGIASTLGGLGVFGPAGAAAGALDPSRVP